MTNKFRLKSWEPFFYNNFQFLKESVEIPMHDDDKQH